MNLAQQCLKRWSLPRTDSLCEIKKFDSNLRNSESYVLPQCASNVYKRFFVNWCFCSLVLSLTSFTHTVLHFFHECLLLDFNKVWVWLCYGRLCHSFNFTTLCVYRWLTAQWWLFDKTEISILGEIARAFPPSLDKMWNFNLLQKRSKNDFIEAVHCSSNMIGCAKALCPFHSSTKVLSPTVDLIPRLMLLLYDMYRNIEYLLPIIRLECLFRLHHWKISWFCQ